MQLFIAVSSWLVGRLIGWLIGWLCFSGFEMRTQRAPARRAATRAHACTSLFAGSGTSISNHMGSASIALLEDVIATI